MRQKDKKIKLAVIFSALAAAVCIIGITVALILTLTENITNTFTPAEVTCQVVEQFENGIKSDVDILNTGNTEAYIRAKVLVTWKNTDGEVYWKAPEQAKDYDMVFGEDPDWLYDAQNDTYYYALAVAPEKATGTLIKSVMLRETSVKPENYDLSVEIIADAIQSTPAEAVQTAWNVTVSNGKIVLTEN